MNYYLMLFITVTGLLIYAGYEDEKKIQELEEALMISDSLTTQLYKQINDTDRCGLKLAHYEQALNFCKTAGVAEKEDGSLYIWISNDDE